MATSNITTSKRLVGTMMQTSRAEFIVGAIKAGYSYSDLARALGISRQRAHQVAMAADGIWQSAPNTDIIKSEMEEVLQKKKGHPSLPTEPMSPSQVSETYGIPRWTINRWASQGIIKVLHRGTGGSNRTLLDPVSLAKALNLYFENPGQGKDPLRPLKEEAATV